MAHFTDDIGWWETVKSNDRTHEWVQDVNGGYRSWHCSHCGILRIAISRIMGSNESLYAYSRTNYGFVQTVRPCSEEQIETVLSE